MLQGQNTLYYRSYTGGGLKMTNLNLAVLAFMAIAKLGSKKSHIRLETSHPQLSLSRCLSNSGIYCLSLDWVSLG